MGKGKGKGKGDEGAGAPAEDGGGPCCCSSDVSPDGKIPPPDPNGMDRSCTDILFLLFFIAFWVGMVICAIKGFDEGDIESLFYFIDYRSNKCGQANNGTTLGKYVYFTHPANKFSNICVEQCPPAGYQIQLDYNTTLGYVQSTTEATVLQQAASWQGDCLSEKSYNAGLKDEPCITYANSAPNGLYWCLPTDLMAFAASGSDPLSSAGGAFLDEGAQKVKTLFADLITGWWIVCCSAGIALVVSFIWVQLLKYCAGCFVWTVIFLSIALSLGLAYGGYYMGAKYKDDYDKYALQNDETMMYVFWVLGGIFAVGAIVLVCMVICLCKKIRIGIGIVKEACEAVTAMPLIVLFPLVQYFVMLIFAVYWIIVAGYMASTAKIIQNDDGTYAYEMNDDMTNAIVYHFFGLLWNMAFFRHFTIMVIAGAIGSWYWTPYVDGDKPELPAMPVYRAFYRTLRYHVGTIAFGSFIIAVIEFAQYVIEYIKRKYMEGNPMLQCIASYIQCCLECFKRIMEFISRNAYIVTACKGKCFCIAAWEAFNFILDNGAQVVAVNWISMYLMFMGKCVIVLGTGALSWLIADNADNINSPIILIIVCCIIAYGVATMFLSVFETAIDTILVCFCWEQSAKGSFQGGHVYATEHLNTFLEGINVEAATSGAKVAPAPQETSAGASSAGSPGAADQPASEEKKE